MVRFASAALAIVATCLTGCSVGERPDATDVVGANGKFVFTLEQPDPLLEGPVDLGVRVARVEDGQPVEGASVMVRVTMPSMGHTVDPLPTEIAGGGYTVEDVVLDMPGAWVVRVRAEDGSDVDEVELPLDVP